MPEASKIKYQGGYKYQLKEDFDIIISIKDQNITHNFIKLEPSGLLTIRDGYAWDGASGPALDTKHIMRGSLVHDALYQLIRDGKLDHSYRQEADRILQKIIRKDGMNRVFAWTVYQAVHLFGDKHSRGTRKILTAPRIGQQRERFSLGHC